MVSSSLEVEAKFAVDELTTVPELTSLPGVESIASTAEHHLSAIYYDTRDLRLTRAKITLRRRTGGKDDGWHIKLPGSMGRTELHAELGEPVNGQFQVPPELLEQVRAVVRTKELVPIAQVDNHRVESVLADAEGVALAEFCDDHVTAWSLLPGGQRTSWREWELELTDAISSTERGAELLATATTVLIGAGARKSASPSKLVAALGDSINNAPVPDYVRALSIDEDSPAAAVVRALQANRDKLIEFDPKVRNDEWDSVHQMRVATRELRSHLQTFSGIIAGELVDDILAELKSLAAMLGKARDAEVVGERFQTLLDNEDSDALDQTTREHLGHDMTAEYQRLHVQVVAALNSDRYLQLLDNIDALLANPPIVAGPHEEAAEEEDEDDVVEAVDEVLAEHVDEAYKKLMKRHKKAVENWDNAELSLHQREDYFHDMRKAAKKLRYATEAVGKSTDLKTKRLYDACKAMQSSLGDFQDSVTSRDKLLMLAAKARRRGEDTFGYGMLYQRERQIGLQALDEYAKGVKAIEKGYEKFCNSRK